MLLKLNQRTFWITFCAVFVALVFFLLMYSLYPFHEVFEFDPDEGINAMKALLLARGDSLYSEIWSDQPPLFTYLLATWFRAFGFEINIGRIMVLIMSSILVSAIYLILRITWGALHAICGIVLLFLLPYYNTLSVSIMIGLPSITLATIALLALIIWHLRRKSIWLVLSAAALAFSVLTKLFTGFLAPIFIIGVLLDELAGNDGSKTLWELFRPALIWGSVFAIIFIGLGLLVVGPSNVNQLLEPHLAASEADIYTGFAKTQSITWYMQDSWSFFLLAAIGVLYVSLKKHWLTLYLIAWAACAYIILIFQIPVWFHHQLLVTIPLAALSAIAVGESINAFQNSTIRKNFFKLNTALACATLIAISILLIVRVPIIYEEFTENVYYLERERMFMVRMVNHAPETEWVITDTPMYAFRAGLAVPPELAVFSEKRMVSGNLSEEEIICFLDKYKPEQVLIARFRLPELEKYIQDQDEYKVLYSRGSRTLYSRK
jgi:hypothetical protein